MGEHRRRTRIEGHFEGYVIFKGQKLVIHTDNLSLKGLKCALDQAPDPTLAIDDECTVLLVLSADAEIKIASKVVRVVDLELGIDFVSMDEESYTHLRNIVRFGADDPDEIDHEQITLPFQE